MQTSPSHSTSTSRSDIHSATIVIHLVNPEQSISGHFKQLRKPHISLTNFADLIKPTPFNKFKPTGNSLSQIVLRSNSSPVNGINNYESDKLNLALRKIRSNQASPIRKDRSRTLARQGTTAPKSRFALESQRCLEDLSP